MQIFQEKTYLVGVECKSNVPNSFSIDESLKELAQLADTAGLIVVGSTYQRYVLQPLYVFPAKIISQTKRDTDLYNTILNSLAYKLILTSYHYVRVRRHGLTVFHFMLFPSY